MALGACVYLFGLLILSFIYGLIGNPSDKIDETVAFIMIFLWPFSLIVFVFYTPVYLGRFIKNIIKNGSL